MAHEYANQEEESDEKCSENDVVEHLRAELEKAKKVNFKCFSSRFKLKFSNVQELRIKNEKCEKLSEMQNIVDAEIHELTASLFQVTYKLSFVCKSYLKNIVSGFQEAYKMVSDANQKRHTAEKLYKEASGKVCFQIDFLSF